MGRYLKLIRLRHEIQEQAKLRHALWRGILFGLLVAVVVDTVIVLANVLSTR